MKIILLIALLFPAFASAQDPFDTYVQSMIEEARQAAEEGNGTVYIENHSSVSTGGQTAAAGQSVSDGDVSASSRVETYINTGDDGGRMQVKIETSRNGEMETEEYTDDFAPGEPVNVEVRAHATSDDADVEVRVNGEATTTEPQRDEKTSENEEARVTVVAKVEHALGSIPGFFKKIFSFLWMW